MAFLKKSEIVLNNCPCKVKGKVQVSVENSSDFINIFIEPYVTLFCQLLQLFLEKMQILLVLN